MDQVGLMMESLLGQVRESCSWNLFYLRDCTQNLEGKQSKVFHLGLTLSWVQLAHLSSLRSSVHSPPSHKSDQFLTVTED